MKMYKKLLMLGFVSYAVVGIGLFISNEPKKDKLFNKVRVAETNNIIVRDSNKEERNPENLLAFYRIKKNGVQPSIEIRRIPTNKMMLNYN